MLGNALHLRDQLAVALVSSHTDSKQPLSPRKLENDQLKPPGRLYKHFTTDVHPLDVRQFNLALPVAGLKDKSILGDNESPIPEQVQNERHKRHRHEEDHDVHDRIFEDEAKLVLKKTPFDPRVQEKHKQIQQCLLVVEIEFVFEHHLHRYDYLTDERQGLFRDDSPCLGPPKSQARLAHLTDSRFVIEKVEYDRFQLLRQLVIRYHQCRAPIRH